MSETNREQSQEEPVVLNSCCLKQLSRVFASKVVELMHAQESGGSEVSPRIIALETKAFPESMLQLRSLQLFHHLMLLVYSDTVGIVIELDANLVNR